MFSKKWLLVKVYNLGVEVCIKGEWAARVKHFTIIRRLTCLTDVFNFYVGMSWFKLVSEDGHGNEELLLKLGTNPVQASNLAEIFT